MKKSNLINLTILLLLALPLYAQDIGVNIISIPLTSPGEPGVLIIDHVKGSLNIKAFDGIAVGITASLRDRMKDSGNKSTGLGKQKQDQLIQLSAQEDNNEVTVSTNSHKRTIDLDIFVPRKFSLKLKTCYNGEIVVKNVSGEMEISNINGSIVLDNVSGSAILNTVDGNISVNFAEVKKDVPMAFTSIYGKIDVTLPWNIDAELKMKTDNGNIVCDFPVNPEKRQSRASRSKSKVSLEEWHYGRINSGGPEILIKSFDGNINVKKRD